MPYPLILASQSKYKKELLERLCLNFTQSPSQLNEAPFKQTKEPTQNICESLALEKAKKVFKTHPQSCVIGADQIAHLSEKKLDKPLTPENALEQLLLLSGQTHELITSVAVIWPKGQELFSHKTQLTMRQLDKPTLKRYIEIDQPLDCAGSYKIEKTGITLFERVESDDFSAIVGLPLLQLTQTLLKIGYQIPH